MLRQHRRNMLGLAFHAFNPSRGAGDGILHRGRGLHSSVPDDLRQGVPPRPHPVAPLRFLRRPHRTAPCCWPVVTATTPTPAVAWVLSRSASPMAAVGTCSPG